MIHHSVLNIKGTVCMWMDVCLHLCTRAFGLHLYAPGSRKRSLHHPHQYVRLASSLCLSLSLSLNANRSRLPHCPRMRVWTSVREVRNSWDLTMRECHNSNLSYAAWCFFHMHLSPLAVWMFDVQLRYLNGVGLQKPKWIHLDQKMQFDKQKTKDCWFRQFIKCFLINGSDQGFPTCQMKPCNL